MAESFVKTEPQEVESLIDSISIQSKYKEEPELNQKVAFIQKRKKLSKCAICNKIFSRKSDKNNHIL